MHSPIQNLARVLGAAVLLGSLAAPAVTFADDSRSLDAAAATDAGTSITPDTTAATAATTTATLSAPSVFADHTYGMNMFIWGNPSTTPRDRGVVKQAGFTWQKKKQLPS